MPSAPQLDAVALVGEPGETMAEAQTLGREGGGERLEKIGAVEMIVGRAEGGFRRLPERGALQRAPVVPPALMHGHRAHAGAVQRAAQAPAVQQPRCVRADLDARADLHEGRRLLEHLHVDSRA